LAVQGAVPVPVPVVRPVVPPEQVMPMVRALREQPKLLHLQGSGSAQCSDVLGSAGE
jgi:hypothetical protein